MSPDGRTQVASIPDVASALAASDGGCVAGTCNPFPPRIVGVRKPVTLDAEQRRGLADLVNAGKMLRRSDCYYSLKTGTTVSLPVARRLKSLSLAVAGFSQDMVASERGKMIAKELEDHDAPAT